MSDIEIFKKYLLAEDLVGVRNNFQHSFLKIDLTDEYRMKPIHWACQIGNLEIVIFFIENGVDLECEDGDEKIRPIHLVCQEGHLEIAKTLIDHNINIECEDGLQKMRPIHWACRNGHLDIVKLLIEHKVNIECEDGQNNMRPIHWACRHGHLEIVKLLTVNKVNIDCEDIDKMRPIHFACQEGHLDIVKFLIKHAADITCEDKKYRMTPIHWVCQDGHSEIAKLLIENGADFECEDGLEKMRPIHWACREGHLEIAKLLIEHDVNLECEDGLEKMEPIHFACREGHLEITKLLIAQYKYLVRYDLDIEWEYEKEKMRQHIRWTEEEETLKLSAKEASDPTDRHEIFTSLEKTYKKLLSDFTKLNENDDGKPIEKDLLINVKDFLDLYDSSLRIKTRKMVFSSKGLADKDKLSLNCLCVSINIVNLLMDHVTSSSRIISRFFSYLEDFQCQDKSNRIARRMQETILYCVCNYYDNKVQEELKCIECDAQNGETHSKIVFFTMKIQIK